MKKRPELTNAAPQKICGAAFACAKAYSIEVTG